VLAESRAKPKTLWRLIVVGGHTRSIGKTQLVCDIIRAFPRTDWVAGKITQYGHGVCAQNGENCDCAPTEHVCALDWEGSPESGTDSARFLKAGAQKSFWLRTKQGYLAEGLPLLREALGGWPPDGESPRALIVESNSLMQFVKPSLYLAVIDPSKEDFKQSAQLALDRAHALILRDNSPSFSPSPSPPSSPFPSPSHLWLNLPAHLTREKPSVIQREGQELPQPIWALVHRILEGPPGAAI